MKKIKRMISVALIVVMMTALTACGRDRDASAKDLAVYDSYVINLWYSNDAYTSYIEQAAKEFNSTNMMITIEPMLASDENFLQNIYESSVRGETSADLYFLNTDMLEEAYLMGIMDRIDSKRIPDAVDAYGDTAVSASSYNDSLYGYPLTFNTSFMVYNKDVAPNINSFEEMNDFIKEYRDGNSKLKAIFECDMENSIINYPYIASYVKYTNDTSTAEVTLELDESKIKSALTGLYSQYSALGVNSSYDMDKCIEMFNAGELAYTFLDANHFSKLDSNLNFGVNNLPSIANDLNMSNFSTTTMIAVNPYSVNLEAAHAVAKAMSYDYSDEFYDLTGKIPACRSAQSNLTKSDNVNKVYDIYKTSTSKARFIGADTSYSMFGTMLSALTKGTGIDTAYTAFAEASLSSIRQVTKQN